MKVVHPSTSRPREGVYTSTITGISFDPRYIDHEAFRIDYELIDKRGCRYRYFEIFHNTLHNARTAQFKAYIDRLYVDHSKNGLPRIAGLREKITLKRRIGLHHPVIVERRIVSTENICEYV